MIAVFLKCQIRKAPGIFDTEVHDVRHMECTEDPGGAISVFFVRCGPPGVSVGVDRDLGCS